MAMSDMKCRICGAGGLRLRLVARGQEIWRCGECGFEQVAHEPSKEVLDAIYSDAYFTSAKYKGDPVALEKEDSRRMELLGRWVRPGAVVLDAGCSTGDFLASAKSRYEMHGVDYSEFAVGVARERNPEIAHQLHAGKLEESPLTGKSFDAICLWDVIEHIWEPMPVIADLLGRLKPGGVLVMSTPAIDAPTARVLGAYWPFMTPPEHLGFFTRRAFEQAARQQADCELVYHRRLGKWANLAFIAYKVGRIAPRWFPMFLLKPLQLWPLKKLSMYVPTNDIQYVVLRKRGPTPAMGGA